MLNCCICSLFTFSRSGMFDVKSLVRPSGPSTSSQRDGPLVAGSLTSIEQPKRPAGRPAGVMKRPSNMKRELYNILVTQQREGKDISSMMPSNVHDMYKNPKANMGKRRVRKYQWVPFPNQARTDGLQLHHWERVDKNKDEPYCFSKWNKVINIPEYTDDIYKKHLQTSKWSREETDLLFEMCRRFDLRWPVCADRYETERQYRNKDGKNFDKRSIEDMKERFYAIYSELNLLKDPNAQPIGYDAEHERRRKEQLRKQLERTQEDYEEEERLQEDLRRIEARRKERERKAQDLQKLINMEQHSPRVSGAHSPAPGKKKLVKSKLTGTAMGGGGGTSSMIPADIPAHGHLRFTEYKSAGSHLKSQEMKLPTNVGQKKMKNIETILDKCKLEMIPMGATEIVAAYNDFRNNIVYLQELKQALQTAEYDLEGLRTRLVQQGQPAFELEPRMRISTLPDGGYDPSSLQGEGAPTSLRRITSWLDINQPAGVVNVRRKSTKSEAPATRPPPGHRTVMPRKRKLSVIPPSPMELKRSRKLTDQ
uniref:DNA methyltransferase 1-associated protein 1 n=1 Tax=Pristionchus pacificus TaxID=54126 RepID=A0A2A6BM63_PRIPA|eukprot:PDM67014.1 ekl-4 [Pristionchus pacificus]